MAAVRVIVHGAHGLANSLPISTVEAVALAIRTCSDATLRAEISQRVPHHQHRDMALAFVDRWRAEAGDIDAITVSVALQTAALAEHSHRDGQSAELVWTGPETGASFRRTEQAILQLLDAAQHRITLVSFAVYSIPNVAKSLVKAAKRGVRLTVIVETPDKLGGENEYNTIKALGQEVANCSTVYYWPKEKRTLSDTNKPGILHVKCAVADGDRLFLSSANLTQQAFTINMELGILVRGGTMPKAIESQFERLIDDGQLKRVVA
jgi:phosphatidylserine/phosphatidylglycerophosphate/cardiolipin synthase-like enzyme